MTVRQLINHLKGYNLNDEVYVKSVGGDDGDAMELVDVEQDLDDPCIFLLMPDR